MNRDYEKLQSSSSATVTHYSGTGTAMSMAANRISFTFNLTGPSFAVDSACSSSLVALHTACQAIKRGDPFSLDRYSLNLKCCSRHSFVSFNQETVKWLFAVESAAS